MQRARLSILVLAGAMAMTACGKDATAPSNQLSAADAAALAQSMAAMSSSFAGTAAFSTSSFDLPSGIVADLVPINMTMTRTISCPAGGTLTHNVTVTGSVDAVAHSATMDMTGSQVWDACAHAVNGKTINVTGNLALTSHTSIVNSLPSGDQTFTQKGSFTFTRSDGVSGSCSVDMSATVNFTTRTRTVTGTFCGRTLSSTLTFG